ncbi:MAG: YraN family protein [Clostridia bacterium]|nr:YraN family protein [Clostridia bacterium]MBQ8446755.1 YraN family protein [Clostridia bacterium]MBQ8447246.1 YraN family protein [Clostridia bacterium]
MPDSPQDVHKKVLGRKGEKLAAEYLKKQGCKIVKRNYKTPFGEADIIAQDKDEIVFVEVKTRIGDKFGTPREAVTKTKQQRYYKIAECYWLKTGEEPNARFDVIEVYEDGRIEQYKNAF